MAHLELDAHGQQVLIAWFATGPTLGDIDVVEDILARYAARDPISPRWHTRRDLVTDDLVISPRDGLQIVVRAFSDDDPEHQFSLVAILDEADQPGP